jgi:hypothetical protein
MLPNIFPGCYPKGWWCFANRKKQCKTVIIILLAIHYSLLTIAQPNINRVEYYIDTDPGYGAATNIAYSGTNNITTNFTIQLASLAEGVHVVGTRSRDVNGAWSLDNKWIFLKPYSTTGTGPVPNINRVEYYIDTDPGYGAATAVSISPGQNLSGLAINLDLNPLSEGVHVVGIRSRDANGAWSLDNKWIFLKPYTKTGTGPVPAINRVEYYIDTDPGYGNGTALSVTPGQNLSGLSFNLNLAPLAEGVHIIGIRSRDANGAWSLDNRWLFLKAYNSGQKAAARYITQVEYYFDTDPGYGNGVQVAVLPNEDIANKDIFANITGISAGVHTMGIRSKDSAGAWSLDNKWLISLATQEAVPKLAINSIAKTTACVKDSILVGLDISGTFNAGNTFRIYLSNSAGDFAAETLIGTSTSVKDGILKCYLPAGLPDGNGYKIRAKSSNPALTSATASYNLAFYDRPFFSNDTTVFAVCGTDLFDLNTIFAKPGYTLNWNTLNPNAADTGSYRLIAINANGCADTVKVAVQLEVATWTGATNTSWHTATNWSTGKVPQAKTHVIIPAGKPNCIISTADATAASIQVKSGAVVNVINNRKINITAACNSLP